jgi:hypothetical protein
MIVGRLSVPIGAFDDLTPLPARRPNDSPHPVTAATLSTCFPRLGAKAQPAPSARSCAAANPAKGVSPI